MDVRNVLIYPMVRGEERHATPLPRSDFQLHKCGEHARWTGSL